MWIYKQMKQGKKKKIFELIFFFLKVDGNCAKIFSGYFGIHSKLFQVKKKIQKNSQENSNFIKEIY